MIDEGYLKRRSIVDQNVDFTLMKPIILEQQRLKIYPVLGTDLYNRIIADIDASTLTGDYLTLVNTYIAPALKNWVLSEIPDFLTYKFRNTGINKQSNETGSPIDIGEVNRLMDKFVNMAN